jgi:hypothetical protein
MIQNAINVMSNVKLVLVNQIIEKNVLETELLNPNVNVHPKL